MDSRSCERGLGLCLSGGGFRASFYHIGVLARMAELGMLKHVEVISTVSGGSIVGAAYYLLVKKLLEQKIDKAVSGNESDKEILHDSDYVDIVKQLEIHFLSAVQKNLRMRTFAYPIKNMKMMLPSYSRSDAIGELYERFIYQPLFDNGNEPIYMTDLIIDPKGIEKGRFHPCDPDIGNQKRIHKVPILVINATSLNSGHNWCFTARSMGEIPPRNDHFRDIDKKDRYRRIRYNDIDPKLRLPNFPLGKAVAASAGVPGLFPPLAVSNLYDKKRVQLVDGGVFDNQGIAGVLDPDHQCSDLIVSDASGQSDATDNPETGLLQVLGNMTSILTGRVREEMVNSAALGYPGHIAYFHLTRGLFAKKVEANKGGISEAPEANMRGGVISSQQEFKVDQEMQRVLAHMRTDLDSFTDTEAACLQADAYQMSESRLRQLPVNYLSDSGRREEWLFRPFVERISMKDSWIYKHLDIGAKKFFKPLFHLVGGALSAGDALLLIILSLPLLALLLGVIWLACVAFESAMGFPLWRVFVSLEDFQKLAHASSPAVYGIIVAFVISTLADKFVEGSGSWVNMMRKVIKFPMSFITTIATRLVLPFIIAIPVWLYLLTIDWFYVTKIGRRQ